MNPERHTDDLTAMYFPCQSLKTIRAAAGLAALTAILLAFSAPAARALTPEEEPVVQVVKLTRPAVVNIYTEVLQQRRVVDPMDSFFEQFYGFSRGGRILQVPVRSLGSGVLVDPKGYIVTNEHVVARAKDAKIKVTLSDGTDYEAKFLRDDPDLDLALIRIQRKDPFPIVDVNQISPNLLGQTVIAIGNPVGYESSVSQGILSAKDRSLTIEDNTYDALLQTDAAINPGNSGGPLVDISGKFVGINSAKLGQAGVDNIGFAIPGERVRAFVNDSIAIAEGKKAEPPPVSLTKIIQDKLGLSLQELDPDLASSFGFRPGSGLIVVKVDKDGPAGKAGVERGMLVTAIGAYRVRTEADIPRNIQRLKTGDKIKISISLLIRNGQMLATRSGMVELTAQ
ncbi:MAG: trypsin-like peptidase domain-containing protein [Candidatus Methylacidiphilales bacterium]|nr:trypsin-like peptidase domain-containing protein [Candidatus Methylacidiphilales bacterium]